MSELADSPQRIPRFDSSEDFRRTLRRLRQTLVQRHKALGKDHPEVLAAREDIDPVPMHSTCMRLPPTSTVSPGGGYRLRSRASASAW